jgi:hypothetical protein
MPKLQREKKQIGRKVKMIPANSKPDCPEEAIPIWHRYRKSRSQREVPAPKGMLNPIIESRGIGCLR